MTDEELQAFLNDPKNAEKKAGMWKLFDAYVSDRKAQSEAKKKESGSILDSFFPDGLFK
jgi:hypothetical protein